MKILYSILLLVCTLSYSQEIRYVNAKNGLIVREKPNLDSQKIGKYNYLEKIEIIKKTGITLSIIDNEKKVDGEWVEVCQTRQHSNVTGYVFDGYLIDEWDINDLIVECPKEYEVELKQDIQYVKEQWENVLNPFIAVYEGNDFGDYHHINFKDSKEKRYDFGFGKNDFGSIVLYYDDKHLNDNPKYLGKSFKIFWEWKISSFPCCSGDYEIVKAYYPSIVKLELIEN